MNVAELISHLQKLPPNLHVVIDSHQSGFSDVGLPLPITVVYRGNDLDPETIGPYREDFEGEDAVLIAAPAPL